MNKLFASSAIALLVGAGAASAAEWEVSIGGFFTGGIGYVDLPDQANGNDRNNVALYRNSELDFEARLTTDSGLTFGVDLELEASAGASDQVDENSAFVSGSFGRIVIGEQDGAQGFAGTGLVTPPFSTAQDGGGFLFDVLSGQSGSSLDNTGRNVSDDLKLAYFTPEFSGFSAGIAFVPADNDNGNVSDVDSEVNGVEVGAGYEGDFGDFSVAVGIGYSSDGGNAGVDDDSSIGGSIGVGFGGFDIGIGYAQEEAATGDDTETFGIGLTYGTGPWKAGIDYAMEVENGSDTEPFGVAVGVSYAFAPGVSLGASIEYFDPDTDADESFALGTFMALSF